MMFEIGQCRNMSSELRSLKKILRWFSDIKLTKILRISVIWFWMVGKKGWYKGTGDTWHMKLFPIKLRNIQSEKYFQITLYVYIYMRKKTNWKKIYYKTQNPVTYFAFGTNTEGKIDKDITVGRKWDKTMRVLPKISCAIRFCYLKYTSD